MSLRKRRANEPLDSKQIEHLHVNLNPNNNNNNNKCDYDIQSR